MPIRSNPFIIPKRRGGTLFNGGSAVFLSKIVEGLLLSVKRVQLVITRKALPHFIHLNFLMLEGCTRTTPAKSLGILNDKFICYIFINMDLIPLVQVQFLEFIVLT